MIMFSWGLEIWYMVCMIRMRMLCRESVHIHLVIRFSISKNKNTTTQRYGDYLNCFGLSDLYVRSKFLSYDILHDFCFEIFYLFLLYGVKCMKECVWLLLFFGKIFSGFYFSQFQVAKWMKKYMGNVTMDANCNFFFLQNIFLRIRKNR